LTAVAFDTHSHLQDRKIRDDFRGVIERAEAAGVAGIALCGYDAPSNELALSLAASAPGVFPTVGFHPHEADEVSEAMLADLETLATLPEVVAVGEIGLDFYRGLAEEANQRRLIDAQLAIALRVGKPVSVHTRGAEDAVHEHLAPYAEAARTAGLEIPGVMHCFGGSLEQAMRYVELGFMVSIAVRHVSEERRRAPARGDASALTCDRDDTRTFRLRQCAANSTNRLSFSTRPRRLLPPVASPWSLSSL